MTHQPSPGGALDPAAIAGRQFSTARRGLDAAEVRAYLQEVSRTIGDLQQREVELLARAQQAEARLVDAERLDEGRLVELLGEETARVLSTSRTAAADIKNKAQEAASRLISQANDEAHKIRADAETAVAGQRAEMMAEVEALRREAATELDRRRVEADEMVAQLRHEAQAECEEMRRAGDQTRRAAEDDAKAIRAEAQEEGRQMVAEAQLVRERMLRDLARRRRAAREQLERLHAARDRLLAAYEVVRRTVAEATTELQVALPEAKIAGDQAMRRVHDEPEPSVDELEAQVSLARIAGLLEPLKPTDAFEGLESHDTVSAPGPASAAAGPAGSASADRAGSLSAGSVPPVGSVGAAEPDRASDTGEAEPPSVAAPDEAGTGRGGAIRTGASGEADAVDVGGGDERAGHELDDDGGDAQPGPAGSDDLAPLTDDRYDAADLAHSAGSEPADGHEAADEAELDGAHDGYDADDQGHAAGSEPADGHEAADGAELDRAHDEVDGDTSTTPDLDELFARLRRGQAATAEGPSSGGHGDHPLEVEVIAGAYDHHDLDLSQATTTASGPPTPVLAQLSDHVVESGDDPARGAGLDNHEAHRDHRGPDRDGPGAGSGAPDDADADLLRRRDEALGTIEQDLARLLKRALADEQNEILDLLRRTSPSSADDLLPSAADHAERYADAARDELEAAANCGAIHLADAEEPQSPGFCDALAADLSQAIVEPLRERIARSFAESGGDLGEATGRLRSLYREWKGQRIADTVRHYSVTAYAHGAYAAFAPGKPLRWLVDRGGDPCPDADDNALAGAVCKGEAFPTGDHRPPAHVGCRCLVVSADR